MICRHCNTKESNRPRGLCYTCYNDPEISPLYPTESKYAQHQGEPTEEELEQIIAEQSANLPEWWTRENEQYRGAANGFGFLAPLGEPRGPKVVRIASRRRPGRNVR